MTLAILQVTSEVSVIEIDTRLAFTFTRKLFQLMAAPAVEVINSDALSVNVLQFPPKKLVANLPYKRLSPGSAPLLRVISFKLNLVL